MSPLNKPAPTLMETSDVLPIDEASLLITCLRGLPFIVPIDMDWSALLKLSQIHGVFPYVCRELVSNRVTMPDYFVAAFQDSRESAEKLASELENLLDQFNKRGIEVLPLKGPVLAQTLYGEVAMRTCDDLDLLVRQKDFQNAATLLSESGFVARTAVDDYHRKFVRDSLMVELHFGLASPRSFRMDIGEVWRRAGHGSFGGKPIRVLSEDDLVLFLCLHGLKHRFSRLIWVLDIAYAFKRTRQGDARKLTEYARRQGLEQVLLIGYEMVRETLPPPLQEMESVIAASPEMSEIARRVIQKIFVEGPGTRSDPDIWSLYLRTERTWGQRWWRRFNFLVPTSEDYAWAEANGIYRRLAPIARPFRLLHKYGLSKAWRVLFPPPL